MVFIQTFEYTDTFQKKSTNFVSLEGVLTYKCYETEQSDYTFVITQGEMEIYLFTAPTKAQGITSFRNMLTYHKNNDPFEVVDVTTFMIPDTQKDDMDLEEVQDLMFDVLEHFGYGNLVEVYKDRVEEMIDEQYCDSVDDGTPVILQVNVSKNDEPKSIPSVMAQTLDLNNVKNTKLMHYH